MTDRVIRGGSLVLPGGVQQLDLAIENGAIQAIGLDLPGAREEIDARGLHVFPAVIDIHLHFNEPGRTEWEGFLTATQAAAAGGVTTLIEMPLNSIPATTTVAGYQEKLQAAAGKLYVDVGFWGGVVPGNAPELRPLWEAGVFGFKCFLVASGVEEFPQVAESDLRVALPELATFGAPLLAHAELPGPIEKAAETSIPGQPTHRYTTWLASRPREAENQAIALLVRLANEFNARIHIVHLSSSDAVPQLRTAKSQAARLTVESCPHYLAFISEEIPDSATEFKCAPPIRENENREKLWAALHDGTIDSIASDHSPCPPSMKLREQGDFLRAWGGIASLQLSLPIVWTQARSRGYALTDVARWMCRGPAHLAGLDARKGALAPGYDADIVIWNPDATFRVDPMRLHHRHKLTPYAGRELAGVVETTFLRGHKIFDKGEFPGVPAGRVLYRGQT